MDLSKAVVTIKGIGREGGSGESGNGSLSLNNDIEGGGHGGVVVVAAGKVCDWCRTGF